MLYCLSPVQDVHFLQEAPGSCQLGLKPELTHAGEVLSDGNADFVVVRQRDANRVKAPQGEAWARHLDQALRATMAGIGLWIDSSAQSPQETVDEILRRLFLSSA